MSPTSPITRPAASHATSTPFETVAEEVFRRYGRVWKPATPWPSLTNHDRVGKA